MSRNLQYTDNGKLRHLLSIDGLRKETLEQILTTADKFTANESNSTPRTAVLAPEIGAFWLELCGRLISTSGLELTSNPQSRRHVDWRRASCLSSGVVTEAGDYRQAVYVEQRLA